MVEQDDDVYELGNGRQLTRRRNDYRRWYGTPRVRRFETPRSVMTRDGFRRLTCWCSRGMRRSACPRQTFGETTGVNAHFMVALKC